MEERLTPGGPCAKAKSLPYWCLPHFNSMNAVELIRKEALRPRT